MAFTPRLPPEVWILIFKLVALYPSPSIGPKYVPFEPPAILLALEEKLRARRTLVLVCKFWRSLATELLYEDVRLTPGSIHLKDSLLQGSGNADGDAELIHGSLVRRAILPYDLTATDRPRHMPALDVLRRCPRLETLVRPRRVPMDNLQWEFPAPSLTLHGLKRIEWWHYNDAARTGGINSFHHVLQYAPNLSYLSIGGELWLSFNGSAYISLPSLATLRLGRMNILFIHQICHWSLPSLTRMILDSTYGLGMEPLWDAFGANLEVVELGSDLRFFMEDHVALILLKCPNLKHFNYYAMFTSKSAYSGINPTVTSIGLHGRTCGLFQDGETAAVEHVVAHLAFVSSATFPSLQQLAFYGDWTPFRGITEFLDMEIAMSARGVTVVHQPDLQRMSSLPPELHTAVLAYITQPYFQQTVYSLSVALPYYSRYLTDNHLFTHVNFRYPGQVLRFYLHLRAHPDHIFRIQTIALSSWTVDADVVVNLLRLLPNIREMHLCIGLNFSPEHLDEVFRRPMEHLKFLGLRFRPYVERATYLQFLKGAYFDSILASITTWRNSEMPSLSIVQDPLNTKYKKEFAQPLVFFRLDPIPRLVRSSFMESTTNFRLRVPSRQVAKYIYTHPASLPNLTLLDLSTCDLLEVEIEELLVRFTSLHHLIVDDCNILSGEWREGPWATLGKSLALVGTKRSKRREQKIKQWLEVHSVNVNGAETVLVNQEAPQPPRTLKKGRRGLAMSSISLREKDVASATISTTGGDAPKVRILPSLPSLLSLSTTTHPSIDEYGHKLIRIEFAMGWAQGLVQLSAVRRRLIQSWMNGIRIVREDEDEISVDEVGFEGLIDLVPGEEDLISLDGNELLELCPCPVLCFAGSQGGDVFSHAEGCGHGLDDHWNMWDGNDKYHGLVNNK